MFRAEADQLALLAKTNSINVPLVYGIGLHKDIVFTVRSVK